MKTRHRRLLALVPVGVVAAITAALVAAPSFGSALSDRPESATVATTANPSLPACPSGSPKGCSSVQEVNPPIPAGAVAAGTTAPMITHAEAQAAARALYTKQQTITKLSAKLSTYGVFCQGAYGNPKSNSGTIPASARVWIVTVAAEGPIPPEASLWLRPPPGVTLSGPAPENWVFTYVFNPVSGGLLTLAWGADPTEWPSWVDSVKDLSTSAT